MAELFGFTITRTEKEDKGASFTLPTSDDGAEDIAQGGFYSSTYDVEGKDRTQYDLIKRYRNIAQQPECDSAIEDIISEAVASNEYDAPISLALDGLKQSDKVKRRIREEFDRVLQLLMFQEKGHDIFRRWYIDGRIYYHKVIDIKKPEEGIQELRYIDASKMRYVRQEMKSKEDKFKVNNLLSKDPTDYPFPKIEEYFIYNPKAAYPTGNIQARGSQQGIKMARDSKIGRAHV